MSILIYTHTFSSLANKYILRTGFHVSNVDASFPSDTDQHIGKRCVSSFVNTKQHEPL
jgi:hypothetical protein